MAVQGFRFWKKNNKCAEKWTEDEVIAIFEDTLNHVIENPTLLLINEVNLYMLKEHGVSQQTRSIWLNKIHNKSKFICDLYEAISQVIEIRVVKDKTLRPNIQALVLQTKHKYAQKQEISDEREYNQMGRITIDGKKLEIKVGK